MEWDTKFLKKEGVVIVKTSGKLTDVDDNQRMITEALTMADRAGSILDGVPSAPNKPSTSYTNESVETTKSDMSNVADHASALL